MLEGAGVITFIKTVIIVVLIIMFGLAIGNMLTGCMSYKYDGCEYERTTTTEKKLNCPAGTGKELGTVPFPGNNF